MSKAENNPEQQVWYIYENEQTRGPITLRDLDVLFRTNQINAKTYCWKVGMKQWKPMVQVEELNQSILESSNQIRQIEKKNNEKQHNAGNKANEQRKPEEGENEQDKMIQNEDENPLAILEVTVDNLLKKSFNQSEDGKWSIYDEQKEEWILQDQEPIQKITQMKNFLLNKLKSQFFADEKNKRKFKHSIHQSNQPQIPLTKQQLEKKQRNKKKTKRAAEKKKEKWYQAKINTFVYISGLPFDITEEELKEFVSRAGVLRIDLSKGKEKMKLYKDEYGLPKGDAAVSYARQQSVQIALQMLNEKQIRDGFKVRVQKAHFNQKDEQYKRRQTKKQTKVKKILAKKIEEKQLGWEEDDEQKGEGFQIIILKYVFTLQQANNEAEFEQIKSDIKNEIQKIGEIKRIRFFENHPDGVVQIKFVRDVDAQRCVQLMNGRFFDEREILCEYWDGETDFKLDGKSRILQEERLQVFANELEKEEKEIKGNALQEIKEVKQDAEDFEVD